MTTAFLFIATRATLPRAVAVGLVAAAAFVWAWQTRRAVWGR